MIVIIIIIYKHIGMYINMYNITKIKKHKACERYDSVLYSLM